VDTVVRGTEIEDGSLVPYLDALGPDIPADLLGPESMTAMRRVAQLLPGGLGQRCVILECDLTKEEPAADLSVLVQARFGRQILAESLRHGLAQDLSRDPTWRSIGRFLHAWSDPQSSLHSTLDHVWLEFDVSSSRPAIVPSVFHGYALPPGDDPAVTFPLARRMETSREAVSILTSGATDVAVLDRVEEFSDFLPNGAYHFQIGVMLSRQTKALRMVSSFGSTAETVLYLDRIGWPGDQSELSELVDQLTDRVDRIGLALDIGTSLHPRIGLECYMATDERPQYERWAGLLDLLIQRGIALDVKCRALASVPGQTDIRGRFELWPPDLREAWEVTRRTMTSVFLRRIHHIKLTIEPDRSIGAKAYLSFRHLWVTPEGQVRSV
jgi:hypothetical protein